MCGSRARTNFSYDQSSSSKLLSATLMAKLHKCHVASLSMSKKPSLDKRMEAEKMRSFDGDQKKCEESGKESKSGEDDDDIEQMIQELLDYGSVELCSVMGK